MASHRHNGRVLPYYLYLVTVPSRPRIAAVLAEVAGVPMDSVGLAGSGEMERDWQTPVLGTLQRMGGQLRLCVELWIDIERAGRVPSEAESASIVARSLETSVCYPGEDANPRPSAYWFALPDGRHTRVRWEDPDEPPEDDEPYVVHFSATEHPIAELPDVPVMPIPEVIHDYPLPEDARLGIPELKLWDHLVVRIESGWPPDGWYPAEFYQEWLAYRDEITAEDLDDAGRAGLAALDARFRALTIDDGGAALRAQLTDAPIPDLAWAEPRAIGNGWWWHRITDPPPWAKQPGAATEPGDRP